jgi:hypothetical protein
MYRQDRTPSRVPSLDELEDVHDLRSVIALALHATPVSEDSLRRCVWNYVNAEHEAGTPPGYVIVALTELVDASTSRPPLVQQSIMRQVILWCVEAYFGHLGGDVVGGGTRVAAADSPVLSPSIGSR